MQHRGTAESGLGPQRAQDGFTVVTFEAEMPKSRNLLLIAKPFPGTQIPKTQDVSFMTEYITHHQVPLFILPGPTHHPPSLIYTPA